MGMRFSDRFAKGGEGFADQAAQFEKQNIERDLRARLEKKREDMELSRTNTLEQFNKTMTPEFMASDPSRADLANVYKSIGAHSIEHQDPSVGQSLKPIFDFLGGDIRAGEEQKKTETTALGQEKKLSQRLNREERKEYTSKVEKIRKFNKDRKSREVPDIGIARTADDAKKLKAAAILKKDLDNKLAEMKKLREDEGFELFPSEASTRGKQLAEQILLSVKDIAGLGILSKSDEGILEKIVPRDPTGAGFKMAQIDGLIKDVNDKYEIGVNKRIEQRYEPGQKFQGVEEPEWTGEGDSPVPDLTIDPKIQEKKRQKFRKRVNDVANDPEKFKKLIPAEEVAAWRADPNNQLVMQAGEKVHKRNNNGRAPTREEIAKFVRIRMVQQKLSK